MMNSMWLKLLKTIEMIRHNNMIMMRSQNQINEDYIEQILEIVSSKKIIVKILIYIWIIFLTIL